MSSSKITIAMAAVLFAAAFAGVMLVTDVDVAAETEGSTSGEGSGSSSALSTAGDGKGDYTVTYSFDGSSIVKKMDTGNQFKFENITSVKAPEGYVLSGWKDVKSGTIYDIDSTTYTFSSDVTVEPVFTADKAIVKLIYGDASKEFVGDSSSKTLVMDDLNAFGKIIGATFAEASGKITAEKSGFEFKGFFKADDKERSTPLTLAQLTQSGKGVATFEAVFEPIYNISFVVEDAQVAKIASNVIKADADNVVAGCPTAPVKENYIFMGWYDAAGNKVIGYSVDKNEYTFAAGKDFKFTEDTTLYAKFVPLTYTVTFVYGEEKTVFATATVKYGEKVLEPKDCPAGYKGWNFDFTQAILADTTVEAIPTTIYNVTFEIDGKAPVTQKSDSMVLPDTDIQGKKFQGWVVKGESQYVDPMKYDIKSDITFVAVYKTADPPAGPGFFETNTGKCVAVIIVVALIAFAYAVYTNMFGMKDFLTSFKVQRVKKE